MLITVLVRRPVRGTSADAWNIAVRTRGVFTHRNDFQKPACAERGLVRTGTAPIISESAVAWTFLVITPTCSRRRPCIPAAVPAQWRRLLIFGNPDITVHGMFQWKLPLAERPTFLRQSHSSGGRQADDDFACSHIGTGKTFNRFCVKMLSVTANCTVELPSYQIALRRCSVRQEA